MWGRRRAAQGTVRALQAEVHRLRAEVDALKEPDTSVTRRQLLRRVGTAAAAGLGIAIVDETLSPAPASAAGPIAGDSSTITSAVSGTSNGGTGGGFAVDGRVTHVDNPSAAVFGATAGAGSAVWGEVNNQFSGAPAVFAINNSNAPGATALTASARGTAGVGLVAEITNAQSSATALVATAKGGPAVNATNVSADKATINGTNSGGGPAIVGTGAGHTGVIGTGITGVRGTGDVTGIVGESTLGTAIRGTSAQGIAINGMINSASSANPAVQGTTTSTNASAAGVRGEIPSGSAAGTGVHGSTGSTHVSSAGVRATATANGAKALYAENTNTSSTQHVLHARQAGTGPAALIETANAAATSAVLEVRHLAGTGQAILGTTGSNSEPAIEGTNTLNGTGVQGNSVGGAAVRGDASSFGKGVIGVSNSNSGVSGSSQSGAGVEASSGSGPQLRINPGTTLPTGSRAAGDVFLDQNGNLFLVKVAGTAPAAWIRVGFNPIDPVRILDTRSGAPLSNGQERLVDIIGVAGIPAGATAVVLNVTAVSPTAAGFLSLYPANLTFSSGNLPTFSNVNFVAGNPPVPNLAQVKIAPPGVTNAGKIKVFHSGVNGSCHVLLDVAGFFS